MLTINLEWDANALAAPQSFRDSVQEAANTLEAAIFDPVMVNIVVGYGEIDGPGATPLTDGESLGGAASAIPVSYPALRSALALTETTASDTAAIGSVPVAASLDGKNNILISSSLAKAFGAIPATQSAIDGYVGFPTSFTGDVLTNAAIVEEVHALGLLNAGGILGLVSYTSPGVHFLPSGTTSSTPAYFSVDGGATDLANYDVGADETLFSDVPNDPFTFAGRATTALTPLDLTELSAIGFDTTSVPTLASATITPTTTTGGSPVLNGQNVTLPEGGSTDASSFISSVSVPPGDAIAYYSFDDVGGGSGHFSLNGIAEPNNQTVNVLSSQLNSLAYVAGNSPGTDRIFAFGFDVTQDRATSGYALSATTIAAAAGTAPIYSIQAMDATNPETTPDSVSGTTPYVFTVSRAGDISQASTLSYNIAGSGVAPASSSMFKNPSGSVSFAAGASSATLTIDAVGQPLADTQGFAVVISGGNGTIGIASASDALGANTNGQGTTTSTGGSSGSGSSTTSNLNPSPPLSPGSIAINAAAVYAFANTGVPDFSAIVNQDGSADLATGAAALTPGFIGGYVAGIEIRVMANLEQIDGSTVSIDAQFGRDMDSLNAAVTPAGADVGFGFLAGLTTGGPTGLAGVAVPANLMADIATGLGSDQTATGSAAGCIIGAVAFAQGYINGVNGGQAPLPALRSIETSALI